MRANSRYEEIKETFRNNEIERDDLSSRIGKLDEKVRVTKQNVEIMVSERMERMKEQLDTTTKVLTLQVEKSAKDLERLKFDLNEMVEQKTDLMMRQFELELNNVKRKYDDACDGVKEAGNSINGVFKKKVRSIKEKTAIFFAQLEMKLEENNQEVVAISKMFREWQETI